MSVRVVLDVTALLAYLRLDGVAVGELIATVQESDDLTGVPAMAVLSAYARIDADERERLADLVGVTDGPTVILPLLAADVLQVAETTVTARVDAALAHAVIETRKHAAFLATYDGADVRRVLDDGAVLDLD